MSYQPKTKPYKHQEHVFSLSKDRPEFALFMEMGTGKTKVLIDTVGHLYEEGRIDGALIFAPKGVYLNWKNDELPAHAGFPQDVRCWDSDQTDNQKIRLKNWAKNPLNGRIKILLMNIESISTKSGSEMARIFLKSRKALCCVDESSAIKVASSKRTKSARHLGALALYRRIMTGTPITQNPLDLYGQCAFLDPKLLGYPTFQTFKHAYADIIDVKLGTRRYPKIVGFRNLNRLTEDLSKFSYRVLKKDCLDLPEKSYSTRHVKLTVEQAKIYEDIKTDMLAMLANGQIASVETAIVQLMRLHQILCGYIKSNEGQLVAIPNYRLGVLHETLEEISSKTMIWCYYREDIRLVSTSLAEIYGAGSVRTYFGDTTNEERTAAVKAFQTDPDTKYFVATQRTAGSGLTLVSGNHAVYYSQGFSLEQRLQSEDRIHRIGQDKNCHYIDFVTPGTIDEKIIKCLQDKKDLANLVLDNLKNLLESVEPES